MPKIKILITTLVISTCLHAGKDQVDIQGLSLFLSKFCKGPAYEIRSKLGSSVTDNMCRDARKALYLALKDLAQPKHIDNNTQKLIAPQPATTNSIIENTKGKSSCIASWCFNCDKN